MDLPVQGPPVDVSHDVTGGCWVGWSSVYLIQRVRVIWAKNKKRIAGIYLLAM